MIAAWMDDETESQATASGTNQSYNLRAKEDAMFLTPIEDSSQSLKEQIRDRLLQYIEDIGVKGFNRMMQMEVAEKNPGAVIDIFSHQLDLIDNLFDPERVRVMSDLSKDIVFMDTMFLPQLRHLIREFESRLSCSYAAYSITTQDSQGSDMSEPRYGKIPKDGAVEWVIFQHWKIARIIYRGFIGDFSLLDTVRSNILIMAFDVIRVKSHGGELPEINLKPFRKKNLKYLSKK